MSGVLVEYLRSDGEPLLLADLGVDYLNHLGIALAQASRPFRVEAKPLVSKKGNTYFEYQQAGVPLPDGLETRLRVGGVDLVMGPERQSQSGNPTREARSVITVGEIAYDVTAYLTKAKQNYWVKVHAQKSSGRSGAAARGPITGGTLV
jgi:hypothetical protein